MKLSLGLFRSGRRLPPPSPPLQQPRNAGGGAPLQSLHTHTLSLLNDTFNSHKPFFCWPSDCLQLPAANPSSKSDRGSAFRSEKSSFLEEMALRQAARAGLRAMSRINAQGEMRAARQGALKGFRCAATKLTCRGRTPLPSPCFLLPHAVSRKLTHHSLPPPPQILPKQAPLPVACASSRPRRCRTRTAAPPARSRSRPPPPRSCSPAPRSVGETAARATA